MKTRESEARPSSRHQRRRHFGILILATCISLSLARGASAQANPSAEYVVKAAFLFHFAQFVEWPEETFKDAGSPLTYCTFGQDPFSGVLDASLSGTTIRTRPIRVLHFKQQQEIEGCQILFIVGKRKGYFPWSSRVLKEMPC